MGCVASEKLFKHLAVFSEKLYQRFTLSYDPCRIQILYLVTLSPLSTLIVTNIDRHRMFCFKPIKTTRRLFPCGGQRDCKTALNLWGIAGGRESVNIAWSFFCSHERANQNYTPLVVKNVWSRKVNWVIILKNNHWTQGEDEALLQLINETDVGDGSWWNISQKLWEKVTW